MTRSRSRLWELVAWVGLVVVVTVAGCGRGEDESRPPPGLLAHLGFEEGSGTVAEDASGLGNDAQLLNGTSWGPGRTGGGLQLDGVNDIAAVSASSSLGGLSAALTVAAWVHRSAAQIGWRMAVSRQLTTSFGDQFYLSFNGSQPRFGLNTGAGGNEYTGAGTVAVGTWVHLAGVYDGGTIKLYVNGVERASLAKTGTIRRSSRPILIGGGANSATALAATETLNGRVDDVRLYSRDLTAGEIAALANGS